MKIKYLIMIALSFGVFTSCTEEDLDPTLAQSKSIETSVNTVNDLEALIIGAYERMSSSAYYGRDFIILGEVMSDNTASNANSNRFVREARMDLLPTSAISETLWAQAYGVIGSANVVIGAEGIEGDEDLVNHIKGQAYAIRALAHFDLVKYYGQQHVNGGGLDAMGVPYVTAFRDNDNLFPSRNTVRQVRDMAYADLETAQDLLSEGLNSPSKEFITSHAAYAIEARIANYFGDWQRALDAAEEVINSGAFSVAPRGAFLDTWATDGGVNSIFEVAFTPTDNPGINGLAMIYQQTNYGDVVVLPNLAAEYGENDVRGVTEYNPAAEEAQPQSVIGLHPNGALRNVGKFPSIAPYEDNVPAIRFEEIVLIYAEALLETGNTGEALVQLNRIPAERGADLYAEATKDNILEERRKELAFEGFRFHDLVRTGRDIPYPDAVLQTHEGPEYGSFNLALPIPAAEVETNANVPQNTGYGS